LAPVSAPEAPSVDGQTAGVDQLFEQFYIDWKGAVSGGFIFTGATDDYVVGGVPLADYLTWALREAGLKYIVRIGPNGKLSFPSPSMREAFIDTLALKPPPAPVGGNPFADFAAAQGQPQQQDQEVRLPSDYPGMMDLIVQFLKKAGGERSLTKQEIADGRRATIQDEDGNQSVGFELGQYTANGVWESLGVTLPWDGNPNRKFTLEQLREPRVPVAAAIVEDAGLAFPNADEGAMPEGTRNVLGLLGSAGTDDELLYAGNPLILLAPVFSKLHERIRSAGGYTTIRVPKPDEVKRRDYIRYRLEVGSVVLGAGLTPEKLAGLTAGLDLRHHHDLFLRAAANNSDLTERLVTDRKREILQAKYEGLITEQRPRFPLAKVGGHRTFKGWAKEWLVDPINEGVLDIYMGLALLGPSGTLKTTLAEGLAFDIGWNFIIWNAAGIRGKYQGETEQRAELTFQAIDSFGRVVVLVDEADKAFAAPGPAGSEGGQAEQTLLGMTQTFMALPEHRGRILWVFTANYPDNIAPAMFRPGRIDVKVPILTPDDPLERAEVFDAQFSLHGRDGAVPMDRLVEIGGTMSDEWTQAEQDRAVVKAIGLERIRKIEIGDALAESIKSLRPETQAVEAMTLSAIASCGDFDLVPPGRRPKLMDKPKLEKEVNAFRNRERQVRSI
jgi:hypothetical protein